MLSEIYNNTGRTNMNRNLFRRSSSFKESESEQKCASPLRDTGLHGADSECCDKSHNHRVMDLNRCLSVENNTPQSLPQLILKVGLSREMSQDQAAFSDTDLDLNLADFLPGESVKSPLATSDLNTPSLVSRVVSVSSPMPTKQEPSCYNWTANDSNQTDSPTPHGPLVSLLLNGEMPDNLEDLMEELDDEVKTTQTNAHLTQHEAVIKREVLNTKSPPSRYSASTCSDQDQEIKRERNNASSRRSRANRKNQLKKREDRLSELTEQNQRIRLTLNELDRVSKLSKDLLVQHMGRTNMGNKLR